MLKIAICTILVLLIIFIIPIIVYGIGSTYFGLKQPENSSPLMFLFSVLIMKIGTAVGFVALFYIARGVFGTQWLLYASIWFAMYTVTEIGQALTPDYSWKDALAGIISEAMYFPLSAFIVQWLIR